jgi:RNA polymerase sigma-70 factor, ECF subfamily
MPAGTETARARPTRPGPTARWGQDPEVQLMIAVQRGDPAAFDAIVSRYWSRVFHRLHQRLGDRQECEDLTQDVFLRLYRYRDRYRPRASFATWVYHITQNVLRNAIRSRSRHACVKLNGFGEVNQDAPAETLQSRVDSPSRPMERAEVAGLVRHAISGLMGRQRVAIEMHQFQDRTYAEIAAKLEMSPKAAKSLLYRARSQLRGRLLQWMTELQTGS